MGGQYPMISRFANVIGSHKDWSLGQETIYRCRREITYWGSKEARDSSSFI